MQTRTAAAKAAIGTRSKTRQAAARTSKKEVLDYVFAPEKTWISSAKSSKVQGKAHTSEPLTVASTPKPRRASSAKAASAKATSSKVLSENLLLTRWSANPPISRPKTTRASSAAPITRSRSRRSTSSPTIAATSKSIADTLGAQDLKRKREDRELFALREESKTFKKQKVSLDKQEKHLNKLEAKLSTRSAHLDEQEAAFRVREEEAQRHSLYAATSASEQTLKYLEDNFSCSLCCDVMACPTSLTTYCGHTFCGLCIFKWYFSKFHTDCGGWHVQVECPLCRAPIRTPRSSHVPRSMDTCPFAPNRVTEDALQSAVDSLAVSPDGVGPAVTGKGKKKTVIVVDDPALDWREGGLLRNDWQDRTTRGKEKRQQILQDWPGMLPNQFLALKVHLGT